MQTGRWRMRGGEAAGAGGSSLSWCTVGYAGGVAGFLVEPLDEPSALPDIAHQIGPILHPVVEALAGVGIIPG